MRTWLLVVVAACEQAQSSPPAPPPPAARVRPHELVATMERSMCYGSCPAYSLSIYADGVVEYSGEHFVKVKGPSTARIPPGRIDELDRLFAEARYFELDSDYTRECSTDSATVDTSYTHHNQFKRISHYEGACNVPPALETLYSGIDRVVGVERWIGTEAEREEHSYGRD